jgi:hypothetical protein
MVPRLGALLARVPRDAVVALEQQLAGREGPAVGGLERHARLAAFVATPGLR